MGRRSEITEKMTHKGDAEEVCEEESGSFPLSEYVYLSSYMFSCNHKGFERAETEQERGGIPKGLIGWGHVGFLVNVDKEEGFLTLSSNIARCLGTKMKGLTNCE